VVDTFDHKAASNLIDGGMNAFRQLVTAFEVCFSNCSPLSTGAYLRMFARNTMESRKKSWKEL